MTNIKTFKQQCNICKKHIALRRKSYSPPPIFVCHPCKLEVMPVPFEVDKELTGPEKYELVLKHLLSYGEITPKEAKKFYQVDSFLWVSRALNLKGHLIETTFDDSRDDPKAVRYTYIKWCKNRTGHRGRELNR